MSRRSTYRIWALAIGCFLMGAAMACVADPIGRGRLFANANAGAFSVSESGVPESGVPESDVLERTDTDSARQSARQEAVRLVKQRGRYMHTSHPGTDPGFWFALAAANNVQTNLSPAGYSDLRQQDRVPSNADEHFQAGAALCAGQVAAFHEMCRDLGIKSRSVQFFNIDKQNGLNHVGAEVWFKDRWNFFDVTWGTFFRRPQAAVDDLMSWEEIRKLDNPQEFAVTNMQDAWLQFIQSQGGGMFGYLKSDRVDVIQNGDGTIRIDQWRPNGNGWEVESLLNLPSFIGALGETGISPTQGIRWRLTGITEDSRWLHLRVGSVIGQGTFQVHRGGESLSIPLDDLNIGLRKIDLGKLKPHTEIVLDVRAAVAAEKPALVCFESIAIFQE